MRFVPSSDIDATAAAFQAEWSRRHPATPPPPLSAYPTPAQMADPLYLEAQAVWDAAVAESSTPPAARAGGTWEALAGGIVCPTGHRVGLHDGFCPRCGTRVPPGVAVRAQELSALLNDRVGLGLLRLGV